MEETQQSDGEEMQLHNQSKVSDINENGTKSSEEEDQIESVEHEKDRTEVLVEKSSQEENPRESSGEEEIVQKTPVENGSEDEKKIKNGNRSTVCSDKNQQEREAGSDKSRLQILVRGEGEGEGQISDFNFDYWSDGDSSGNEEEQCAFMKEVENFYGENNLEFKAPKFYGEPLNLLKLWRQTTRLGGYEKVTSLKLWRQVGESFNPPKTCTTVSWTFRGFYEKALLEYEKHKIRTGQLHAAMPELPAPSVGNEGGAASCRARRDAAARAMEGWHSQRVLGNGQIADAIIKNRSAPSFSKKDKFLKNSGSAKRKKPCTPDRNVNRLALIKYVNPQLDVSIVDEGLPADWVKINVKRAEDCYEVYALIPGLLREEVRVKSDPSGRVEVSGEPEQPDNPWGVTPFKKVITLPSCIDPHNTSAVVSLHGQLLVRAPFSSTNTSNK